MNIQEKEQVVEKAKARFMDCEHKVETTKKTIDEADKPFRIKIGKLETERNAIIEPMYETLRGDEKVRDEARNIFYEAQQKYDAAVAEGKVPANWDAFNEWWAKVGKHLLKTQCGWRNKWEEQVKGPKIDGCTVWAGKSDTYNEKVYCVWETSGRFVGVMVVEPAQHIGDYTSAKVVIGGKEVGEGFGSDSKKPVARFVEAVKWAVAKNAPIWRDIKKGETLPVGAIIKVQTYGGYSGHEKFDFGTVTSVYDNGSGFDWGHEKDLYTDMVEKFDPEDKSGRQLDRCAKVQVDKDGNIVTIETVLKAVV